MSDSLIVIPTFNEKENIERILRAIFSLEKDYHVLVVDDCSPDGTANIIKFLQKEFKGLYLEERSSKLGLGTAYIHGFKWALEREYHFIFEMDADFSHNPNDLIRLYDACSFSADISVGSRYIQGVNIVNWPMSRLLMSYFASKYVQLVTGLSIKDSTAGFVCYKRSVLETINLEKIDFIGYAFQIEMKFKSWKHGFTFIEIPVIFTDRIKGTSKMNSDIFFEAFIGVIQMKIKSWFTKFDQKK